MPSASSPVFHPLREISRPYYSNLHPRAPVRKLACPVFPPRTTCLSPFLSHYRNSGTAESMAAVRERISKITQAQRTAFRYFWNSFSQVDFPSHRCRRTSTFLCASPLALMKNEIATPAEMSHPAIFHSGGRFISLPYRDRSAESLLK